MKSGVHPAAIACCAATVVVAVAACLIFGGDIIYGSGRGSDGWIASSVHRPQRGISSGLELPRALPHGEAHAPYPTQPPSFLSSPRYEAICAPSPASEGQQSCSAPAYHASRLAAQPCTPTTLSGWNGTGSWYRGQDGHYLFEPEHCTLRRLTAQQARQCLNRKFLAFVGDSITRYQYLSLNHYLSQGVWPERYGGNPEFGPSVCIETEFDGDWPEFYKHTTAVLSDACAAKSFESCNCRRESIFKFLTRDYMNTKDLNTAIQGFAVQPPLYSSGALVYNVGLWVPWGPGGDFRFFNQTLNEVSAQLPSLLPPDAPRLRLLWKTTTSSTEPEMEAKYAKGDADARQLLRPPWELLDARALTAQAQAQHLNFTWDPVHYIPIVYEELNYVLLNMLCDADMNFVGEADV